MFYVKCRVLEGGPFPEPVEIRGAVTNVGDMEEADVVITNIHQLQGASNRWLQALPADFFDLIVFDEGHHNVADSWQGLRAKFPEARIVNFSATPTRADGQLMSGRILYSYPVARAIQEGYIKHLKAVVLKPADTAVRAARGRSRNRGQPRRSTPAGRGGCGFSPEHRDVHRNTEHDRQRINPRAGQAAGHWTGDNRLKIIASALNFEHCRQVVEAYRARGRRADYVHSREDSAANERVMQKLNSHELDVIVQVRKLGEGFDHKFLSVAAVFSVFRNLSPFVQFVGRIMRVIEQDAPGHPLNRGVVVFHAGANIARRWEDFQQYSEADQAYFDQLLPVEGLDFGAGDELEVEPPAIATSTGHVDVRSQTDVRLEEIPLIAQDPEALAALTLLRGRGYTVDQVAQAFEELQPVPVTKARQRQARRSGLDMRVKTEAARILALRKMNPEGSELDRQRLGRSNLIVLKSAIDRQIAVAVGRKPGERHEFGKSDLDRVDKDFAVIVARAVQEVFDSGD